MRAHCSSLTTLKMEEQKTAKYDGTTGLLIRPCEPDILQVPHIAYNNQETERRKMAPLIPPTPDSHNLRQWPRPRGNQLLHTTWRHHRDTDPPGHCYTPRIKIQNLPSTARVRQEEDTRQSIRIYLKTTSRPADEEDQKLIYRPDMRQCQDTRCHPESSIGLIYPAPFLVWRAQRG